MSTGQKACGDYFFMHGHTKGSRGPFSTPKDRVWESNVTGVVNWVKFGTGKTLKARKVILGGTKKLRLVPIFFGEFVANLAVGQRTSGIGVSPKPAFRSRLGPIHYSTMPPASTKGNTGPVTTLLSLIGQGSR